MDSERKKPGNYLSIDGGPSGLPALYTLEEVFNRLQDDLKLDEELVPRRWFNIIIGTGRGAIIALLLGKLGLTVSKTIEAYMKLEPILSVRPAQNNAERDKNTEEFKRLFKEVLSEADVKEDAPMLEETETKTIICVSNALNVSGAHIIRSYPIRGVRAAPCTVLEAACACIAFPDRFPPVVIGSGYKKMTLVDAVAGYANPTKELLKEAQKIFGEEAEVATVFSIGAGKWSAQITTERGRGVHLDEALKRGVFGSEQVHQDLQDRLLKTMIYYRFNVEQQLDNESDTILAYISTYLGDGVIGSRLDEAISRIQTRPSGMKLKDINSVTAVEIKLKPRPRLIPHFIGRDDILEAMRHSHFNSDQAQRQSPMITILSGIGGLGKTQTALKFALEFEKVYPDVPVYFLHAGAADKLENELETVIRSQGTAYHTKSYEDALLWLATEVKNWLVIFDNADDPNIDPVLYIPQCGHGHVVITTRNATLAALAPNTSHALEGLSIPDSIGLVLTASNYPNEDDNRISAEKIVLELGCLPLALAHAAGYIFVHRCLGTYLEMYRKNREKVLASTNSKLLDNYRSSVAMTIEMSVSKLTERARDIMRLFSHLSATSIPLSIIAQAAERQFRRVEKTEESSLNPETIRQADDLMKIFCPGGRWSEFDFNESIHECLQYSLLQLTTQKDDIFYSMHVLVQSHLQTATLIHDHQPKRLICRLLGSAVTIGDSYKFLAFNRLLLPHIQLLQIKDVTEAGDRYGLGSVLQEVGDARLAVVHLEKCTETWGASLGEENADTILVMNDLAISYSQAGKNQAALELNERVLSLRKRLFGPEDLSTVVSMGNLASSYGAVGRNQASVELKEEVLSLLKRLLGPEHPDTIGAMGNLAASYSDLGRNQAALELEEEVLSLRKKLLAPEHPDTVLTMGNLARLYSAVGKTQVALELEEEVLSLQKKLLGPEHRETMTAMGNLAFSYSTVGKYQAALELNEEVLSLQKRLLGPEHPNTVLNMGNLAELYGNVGKNQAALELNEEVLSLQRRLLGPEHPFTVVAMNNLASSYSAVGRNQAALGLEEEVLSLRKRLLGPEHPATVESMNNLASFYTRVGRNQAALELQEEVLLLLTRLLGQQHPKTLIAMENLSNIYHLLDMQAKRLNLLKIAVPAYETAELFGVDHPTTVQLRNELKEISAQISNGSE